MKSKLLVIPILSFTFLVSGCGSDSPVNKTIPETTIESTTQQTTETTVEQITEDTTIETTRR